LLERGAVAVFRGRAVKKKRQKSLIKNKKTIDKSTSMVYNGTPYCGNMRYLPKPLSMDILPHTGPAVK
jgi:hypothetical protein